MLWMTVNLRFCDQVVHLFVELKTHDYISISSSFDKKRFFVVSTCLQSIYHQWGVAMNLKFTRVKRWSCYAMFKLYDKSNIHFLWLVNLSKNLCIPYLVTSKKSWTELFIFFWQECDFTTIRIDGFRLFKYFISVNTLPRINLDGK